MTNLYTMKKNIDKVYRQSPDTPYSFRFYQDLFTGFSFTLNEKGNDHNFFTFEPSDCIVSNLLYAREHYNLSHKIEEVIQNTAHSLIEYGKAYIYLQPQYIQQESNKDKKAPEVQTISALDIGEVKGIIKQKTKNKGKCILYRKGLNSEIIETELLIDGLISLDIKELGYSRKYFPKLLNKLSKCDVISSALMTSENTEGYDYNVHTKKKRLIFLKTTKSIGWTFGNNDLSDSYILYKKILQDKFRIELLNFIINKINEGFSTCLHNESCGKLIAHIRKIDYNDVWSKYETGELTVTELTNLLY